MDAEKREGIKQDLFIEAAPANDSGSPKGFGRARAMQDSKAWKASKEGAGRLWNNYRRHLASSFAAMTRAEQESLVQRLCVIITVGVTCLALVLFYSLIHPAIRIILVPAAGVGAFWAGNKIVTPVVLLR